MSAASSAGVLDQVSGGAGGASPAASPQSSAAVLDQVLAGTSGQTPAPDPNQPNPEEQSFLQAHPDHKWMPPDEKFPNRPPGIYPTGRGNEWRNDPSYAQAPVDLHLGAHSVEGAAEGAAAVAPVLTPEIAAAGIGALKPALARGIVGMGEWAAAHPVAAKMIWEGLKAAMTGTAVGAGAKIAGKVIGAAP
jgi:hypothetical protein